MKKALSQISAWTAGRRIYRKEINFTVKEFDVLELLVFNPNKA